MVLVKKNNIKTMVKLRMLIQVFSGQDAHHTTQIADSIMIASEFFVQNSVGGFNLINLLILSFSVFSKYPFKRYTGKM
jgi:hypothetical protein